MKTDMTDDDPRHHSSSSSSSTTSASKSNTHTHTHPHHNPSVDPQTSSRPATGREASVSWDLERTFTHPAGLRVARQVTRSLISQQPIFGSNPEVMVQLQRIMEMNDDIPANSRYTPPNRTAGVGAPNVQSSNDAFMGYRSGGGMARSWGTSDNTGPATEPPLFPTLPPIRHYNGQAALSTFNGSHRQPANLAFNSSNRGSTDNQNSTFPHGTGSSQTSYQSTNTMVSSLHNIQFSSFKHTQAQNMDARTFVNKITLDTFKTASSNPARTSASGDLSIIQYPNPNTNTQITKRKRDDNPDGTRAPTPVSKKKPKIKPPKPQPKIYSIPSDIWIVIFEFSHPSFLNKARLINKKCYGIVEQYKASLFTNSRIQNNIPQPLPGTSEAELNGLLGGFKGCQNDGCKDGKAHRTHWACMKILCHKCWLSKIMRKDKVMKEYTHEYASINNNTLQQLLDCIPSALQDSYFKAVDWKDDLESVRGQPRLYKVYYTEDVDKIITEYKAFVPPPLAEDPEWTPQQRATRTQEYSDAQEAAVAKQATFITERKAKNETFMDWVKDVEKALKVKSIKTKADHDKMRNARRKLFTSKAEKELPHISIDFVHKTKAYKSAVRIFRDAGSERGWNALKPKIQKEWDVQRAKGGNVQPAASVVDESSSPRGDDVDEDQIMQPYENDNSQVTQNGYFPDPTNSFNGFAHAAAHQAQSSGYESHTGRGNFFPNNNQSFGNNPNMYNPSSQSAVSNANSNNFGPSQQPPAANASSAAYSSSQASNGHSNIYGFSSQNTAASNTTHISINSLLGPSLD